MEGFIARLKAGLAGNLPGEEAQFRMAPRARLRMEEALSRTSRLQHSAVLLYLFPDQDDWRLVLMKRPDYDGAHGGQVSIPGGRLEPGENHTQAALREFEEETGISVSSSQLLGRLSELFIPPSSFLVKPFVACAQERPRFDPDPVEVEQIIELTVSALMSEATVRWGRVRLSSDVQVETPYFDVQGHMVWGATAMILSELKEILGDTPYP
jgi:8-oxo-dGTP pyrophosphatase MutT (NUDIX family)